MTKEVVTIVEEDSIERCANILANHDFSGLPVLDKEGRIKGILTEGDLIRRSSNMQTPAYLELLGGIIYLEDPNKFIDDVQKSMGLFAGDAMTKEIITIHGDETVEDAATLLVREKINRLPVVDGEDKLLGIVSRKDIMNHLFDNE